MVGLCRGLGIEVGAECVETVDEYTVLRRCDIQLMQGYLFARPAVEALPAVTWPEPAEAGTAAELATSAA